MASARAGSYRRFALCFRHRAFWRVAAIVASSLLAAAPARSDDPAFRSEFFVDSYNAPNDGIADAREAIKAAIADAASTNGVVKLGSGVYLVSSTEPDGVALPIDAPILIKGVGSDRGAGSLGTVLLWQPPAGPSNPVLMKVGKPPATPATVVGFGIQDLTIRAENGQSGHVLWWTGVAHSQMQNVEIRFTDAESGSKAALYLESTSSSAPTSNNWFINCRFLAPTAPSGFGGYGVLIESQTGGSNRGNEFINCVFSNASTTDARGVHIRRLTNPNSQCDSHHFTNCEFSWEVSGVGVELNDTDYVQFANCVFDGADDGPALQLLNSCEGVSVFGAVNGTITDDQPNPERALRLFDLGREEGAPIRLPYITLSLFKPAQTLAPTPRVTSPGTIWAGTRDANGTPPDSLFVFGAAGVVKVVKLLP